jgi:uncharacterized protein YndB with AHSA1/START domain
MNPISHRPARSLADVGARMVMASVDVAAPPERVFEALASEEIAKWWGDPAVYVTTAARADVRPGGRWRCDGVGADGVAFYVEGEYLVVERPHRLVCTWEPAWAPEERTKIHYTLEAIEGGTRVTLRHEGFTSAEQCQQHGDGWEMVLGWLSRHFPGDREAGRSYWMIRLLPPRPSFMMDMNADERAMMMAHAVYWRGLMAQGMAVAFGPVAAPDGGFGLGVLELPLIGDDAKKKLVEIEAADPAVAGGRGLRYEVLPMVRGVVRVS